MRWEQIIYTIVDWGIFLFCGWMIWRWAAIQKKKAKQKNININ